MEAVMGETGEGSKEGTDSSVKSGEVRVNGEMNGSCEEEMEVCEKVPQHDIVSKSLSSDVMSDKGIDDISENSLSDNVSNCSKDFNNSFSVNEREETKVPNSKKLSENETCKDLGTEVPRNDREENTVNEDDSRDEGETPGKDEEMEVEEGDVGDEDDCEDDENRENSNISRNSDMLDKEDMDIDIEKGVSSPASNHVKSSDKSLGSGANSSDEDNNQHESSEERKEELIGSRDKDKDSCNLEIKAVDKEEKDIPEDGTERSDEANHIGSSKESALSSKDETDKSKVGEESKEGSDDSKGAGKTDSAVNPDIEEISNDSMKSSKSVKSPKIENSEENNENHGAEKDDEANKKDGDMDTSDSKGGDTPGKVKKARKSAALMNVTPRRSSRNLTKAQKSYVEKEDDPDIEEITPEDPLADPLSTDPLRDDKENSKTRNTRKTTIVVNDTKRLVEIATGTKGMKGGKKEPTLVIIDTNSILSGRGPVPVSQGPPPPPPQPSLPVVASAAALAAPSAPIPAASSSGYSVLPVAVPAQGIYPSHPSMRMGSPIVQAPPPPPKPPQILPTLTDDMYVVEAPSFIVPYVYEKPPIKPLKEFIEKLGKEIEEMKKKEEKERQEKEKEKERERQEREKEREKELQEKEKEREKELQEKEKEREKELQEKEKEMEKEVQDKEKEEEKEREQDKEKEKEEESDKESKDDCESNKNDLKKNETENKVGKDNEDVSIKDSSEKNDSEEKEKENEAKTKAKDQESEAQVKPNEGKSLEEKRDSTDPKKEEDNTSNKSGPETRSSLSVQGDKDNKDRPDVPPKPEDKPPKPPTYFDNPLGKFFMQIGVNLVQEYVQTDLLRSQKRKLERDGGKSGAVTQFAINSLLKNLELSKENNEPFHLEQKKCEYCSFKTESSLVMAQHLETPHMRNYVYRCNFCPLEVRSPHDILFHMEAEHNVRGRLERAPAFHQCPNCPFEDNQKGKLTRHLLSCAKKHKPERNQEPPPDWEPPAKIPRVSRSRPASLGLGAAAYQAMAGKQVPHQQHPLLPKLVPAPSLTSPGMGRGRGRPPIHARYQMPDMKVPPQRGVVPPQIRQGMMYRPSASGTQPQMLLGATYQFAGNQIYQVVGSQGQMMPMVPSGLSSVPRLTVMPPSSAGSGASAPTPVALVPNIAAGNNSITIQSANNKNPAAKLLQQPSISITPLPRQPTGMAPGNPAHAKHGTHPGGKATFVICEICDGYIKDLEQLRNHMQWIHKVKIHPKMIYNRPPLNCQKCQFRFFTDQGLERHLLGSHGLVTSSMQEAANKGKDGGRCPVCGRVYQWKLLNHVARDHNMTLKPAHLSYKCTVCTATFGMYKQFENHVYSAHSVVAKRVMDKKAPPVPRPPQQNDAILKPLKINDEITIIPQPARPRPGPASRTGAISAWAQEQNPPSKVHACENCEATFDGPAGFAQYVSHIKRRHLRRCGIKLCRLDGCPTCKRKHVTQDMLDFIEEQKEGVDVIELSDDEVVIAGQGRNEITITKVSCAPGPRRFKQRLQQSHNVQVIEIEDSPIKNSNNSESGASRENGEDSLTAVKERLRRRKSLEISQVDSECSSPQSSDDMPPKKKRRNDDD